MKFSPDGHELISGSETGTVRIHDAFTGEERLAFFGLNTAVVEADFSPDSTLIAAINTDGVAKVWDRKLSRENAQLPKRPDANEPPIAKDADGWEDLLAQFTPDVVEKTGHGWSLKDGELFSPDGKWPTLPLPGDLFGASYQVRVKLRQLTARNVFHVVLPVGDRMTGFELDGYEGRYTGLQEVNGKRAADVPGIVKGRQVKDSEPHVLDVTVRLDGANATIITTLDTRPLYTWTGSTAALSQNATWATTAPGSLALGAAAADWVVSEVKVKRLDAEK